MVHTPYVQLNSLLDVMMLQNNSLLSPNKSCSGDKELPWIDDNHPRETVVSCGISRKHLTCHAFFSSVCAPEIPWFYIFPSEAGSLASMANIHWSSWTIIIHYWCIVFLWSLFASKFHTTSGFLSCKPWPKLPERHKRISSIQTQNVNMWLFGSLQNHVWISSSCQVLPFISLRIVHRLNCIFVWTWPFLSQSFVNKLSGQS